MGHFISFINALVQNLAPDWVRARVLAIFILVYQGSYSLGTAVRGAVAQKIGRWNRTRLRGRKNEHYPFP
jgi:hypothetical protein